MPLQLCVSNNLAQMFTVSGCPFPHSAVAIVRVAETKSVSVAPAGSDWGNEAEEGDVCDGVGEGRQSDDPHRGGFRNEPFQFG